MSTLTFIGKSQTRKRNSGYDLWIEAGNHGTEQDYELALHGISVAQVALYKRASSTPSRYDDAGGSTVTYTFESGSIVFANPDPNDPDFDANSGWCRKMYSGSDDIYVVFASANNNGPTDTITATQFSPPALLSMAGAQGNPGSSGCIVPIYKASSTTPYPSSMPTSDNVQFTFATGTITNLDNGWVKDPPTGDKVWCSTAIASGTGDYAIILHTAWSEPVVWKEKGVSFAGITEHYLASSADSGVTISTTGWDSITTLTPTLKYLWNYEEISYSDGRTTDKTTPRIVGYYKDKGISLITDYYATSQTSTKPAISAFSTTRPTIDSNTKKYLWNFTLIAYTDGTYNYTTDQDKLDAAVVIGVYGDKGVSGTDAFVFDFELTSQTYPTNKRLTGFSEIQLNENVQGYTTYTISWSTDHGSFSSSDPTATTTTSSNPKLYIPYTETSVITITLTGSCAGTTLGPVTKKISNVDETEYNHDFGTVSTLPTSYTDSSGRTCNLLAGDYFVASAVFSLGSEDTVIGYPYIYNNTWGLLNISSTNDPTDAERLLNCISDIMSHNAGKQPTDSDYINLPANSPLYTWCVNFVAQTAVINSLFSRAITLLTGGSFKSAQLTYDSVDPRFVSDGFILDSNGEAKLGKAYLRDIKIRCTDTNSVILLETQEYQPSSTSIACSSKTNWLADDLYNAIPSVYTTGTYNSGSSYKLMKNTATEGTAQEASDFSYGVYYWTNGSTTTHDADGRSYTVAYTGWYYISSSYSGAIGTYPTSCPYIQTSGGTIIISGSSYDDLRHYDSDISEDFNYTAIGKKVYLTSGTVLKMYANSRHSKICIAIEKGSVGMFDSSSWTTDIYSEIGDVKHRVLYKQFRKNCYYSGRLIVDSYGSFAGFDSNDHISYASINGWYNNLTAGRQTDLENSSITISGTTYTVNYVTKSSGLLEFYDSNGNSHTFIGPSTSNEGGDVGWYNISGTLYPIGQKSSLNTHNLNATENDSDIGADKAYRYIFATKFAGNVNGTTLPDGTSYKVWGAVFN